MEKIIYIRRVTVFVDHTVPFSRENRERLAKVFPGALVAPNVPDIGPQPILSAPPIGRDGDMPWYMRTWAKGRAIQFNLNRIDIVEQANVREIEAERQLVGEVLDDLKKALEVLDLSQFSRLAYSPSVAVEEGGDFSVAGYFARHLILPEMEGANLSERNIYVTYHVNELIDGESRPVNWACRISEGFKKGADQERIPTLILETDINTSYEMNVCYGLLALDDFFPQAIGWSERAVTCLMKEL